MSPDFQRLKNIEDFISVIKGNNVNKIHNSNMKLYIKCIAVLIMRFIWTKSNNSQNVNI